MKYLAQNLAKMYVQCQFKNFTVNNTNSRQGLDRGQCKLEHLTMCGHVFGAEGEKGTGGGRSLDGSL